MRLELDARARRWLRGLPASSPVRAGELVLLALVASFAARLFWALLTPQGAFGDWKASGAMTTDPSLAQAAARFDPFFRLSATPGATVTSLSLKLYGVRVDEAMGRSSAIIATPDGIQSSYGVGEEIVPGVKLKAVAYDGVTLERGGVDEQLFLDQSVAAPVAQPGAAAAQTAPAQPAPGGATVNPARIQNDVAFAPRTDGGRVTGLVVSPKGGGEAFRALGLQPGDIVTAVNGRSVASAQDAATLASDLPQNEMITFQIERGGQTLTLSAKAGQ